MCDNVTVDVCVGVRKGCPIDYLITADKQAEFSLGGLRDGFHFAFDPPSLRAFLEVGAQALAELEAPESKADAHDNAPAELATISRRSA